MADTRELMARYCDGDAPAFHELYRLVAPPLFGYLCKMARERTIAADVLQQTFMKVHHARAAYIHGADPVPWIYAIAHRTFIDFVRKHRRDVVELESNSPIPDLRSDLRGETDEGRDEPPDPDLVAAALAGLATLSPEQRQAVVLMKLQGKTLAEAAEIAGTTVGAMKVRAHRGYRALRDLLGDVSRPPDVLVAGAAR